MKFVALCFLALCVTLSVEGKSIETRNAVVDKIVEELMKVKDEAVELIHDAEGKVNVAVTKALEDFKILKAKIQAAAAKGEEISQKLIAEVKANILEEYQKVKPIIEDLKAKVKSKVEDIIEKIKESDAVAEIKNFAEKVKSYITNFIDHVPDYEDMLKEKFEEVKAVVIEKAKIVKERLVEVKHEAQQKLEGLILIAEKILKEKVEPKIKSEVDALIALAKVKLQVAQDAADALAEQIEAKIEAILEKINDKTHGVADELIEKYEAKLKALIAEAEEKISSLKDKTTKLMDEIKSKIDDFLGKTIGGTFGSGSDALVEKIMEKINKPISKLPDSIQSIAGSAIEHALRFGLKYGKTLLMKLIDLVGDHFGDDVQPIIEMVKIALSMAKKRGASTEVAVAEALKALEKPLEKLPEGIRFWVKEMVEEVLRFGFGHGKKGINHLLDLITDKFGDEVKPVIDAVKDCLDKVVYIQRPQGSRGATTEVIVKEVLAALEKPLGKVNENMREWVLEMIEQVIRFGLGHGKKGVNQLLDMISDKAGDEVKEVIETVKNILDQVVYFRKTQVTRGASTEVIVKEVMAALEKPLKNLPENIGVWVKEMIESVIRFSLGHGKNGVNHLLDMIVDRFGDEVKPVIDAVKDVLDKVVYGATTEVTVTEVINALDKALQKVPENIREWVKEMVEEVIRFGLGHGAKGINHLLDMIAATSGDDVKPVIEAAKDAINKII